MMKKCCQKGGYTGTFVKKITVVFGAEADFENTEFINSITKVKDSHFRLG